MNDDTREALTDLLAHPGWRAFTAHVADEWAVGGHRFESQLNGLAADTVTDSTVLMGQLRQMAVARREILRLLKWPEEELTRLRKAEKDTQGWAAIAAHRRS